MKNIFSIIALMLFSCVSMAQNTSTRSQVYGTTDASSISFGVASYTDTARAGLDTIKINPRHSRITLNVTVTDSCAFTLRTLAGCYKGDYMDIYITNPAQTGVIKLLGGFTVSTGTTTISLTANKHDHFAFWFDGVGWVEDTRLLNY